MNEATQTMNVEKKAIRSDIPVRHSPLQTGTLAAPPPLVIGRGISLDGAIGACAHLVIEGSVRAEGFSARRLDIPESGSFQGSAEVHDVIISGKFEGRLIVPGRLTIRSTARISADIAYGTVEVETGAKIEGTMSFLPSATVMEANPTPVRSSAVAPVAKPLPAASPAPAPANVERLFDERAGTPAGRARVFRRAG